MNLIKTELGELEILNLTLMVPFYAISLCHFNSKSQFLHSKNTGLIIVILLLAVIEYDNTFTALVNHKIMYKQVAKMLQ